MQTVFGILDRVGRAPDAAQQITEHAPTQMT